MTFISYSQSTIVIRDSRFSSYSSSVESNLSKHDYHSNCGISSGCLPCIELEEMRNARDDIPIAKLAQLKDELLIPEAGGLICAKPLNYRGIIH
ncbi:hypothetical protein PPL_05097 [Heterostelium album PN500]|uniref:Uncharacterized protein n=1 Tax=Heterostelium pallidum (strain ATCC 26659 / Pp 5 / PN500) TaxID=670386 RepID=D3B9F3_HETP5|nr:hypothetical protein PPL_05097 [Heterostelium album PN500]EFA81865.1 hypothetical protein PPL_05097 [Heterostelium album PN500]|eukprot:XP_020433982.1 hypothetical protein PPL_05097 [Heterostelium album PN500]